MRPIQKTMLPTVLFRFTIDSRPNAIIGICAIYLWRQSKVPGLITTTHLHQEEVRPDFFRDDRHHKLVTQRGQQKGDDRRGRPRKLEAVHR